MRLGITTQPCENKSRQTLLIRKIHHMLRQCLLRRRKKTQSVVLSEPLGRWKVKKKLAASNLEYYARLSIPIDLVRSHVLPYLGNKFVNRVETETGFGVTIHDCYIECSFFLLPINSAALHSSL
ncbi:hypothetical protein ACFX1T_014566 [Malus domestica]